MTGRRALAIGCAVVAVVAARSWLLPASAPAWLRGASPFSWTETRAERERCLAFASMIGSTPEPWSEANDWTSVHAVEERLRALCIDSAAIRYPTSRFADRT